MLMTQKRERERERPIGETLGLGHVQRTLDVLRAKRETGETERERERDLRLYTAN